MASEMPEEMPPPPKMVLYRPGSKRDWIDDTVNPQDAMQEIEVEADIFYDFFLSIPLIKSVKRFKDTENEWLAKLEVLATAIPDGLRWVEMGKPGDPSDRNRIYNKDLADALAGIDRRTKEKEFTPEEWDKFGKENPIDLTGNSWIRAGNRFFKPAAVEGEKKAQDLKDEVARLDFGNNSGQIAVQILEACAADYKRATTADSIITVLETQKKCKLYCGQFDKKMPTIRPVRKLGEVTVPGTNVPVLAVFLPSD
jgi:hypothetical protein